MRKSLSYNRLLYTTLLSFVIIVILQFQAYLYAGKSSVANVDISEKDRVYLFFQTLTKAINNPDKFYIDVISTVYPEEDRNFCEERITHFCETTQDFGNQFDFDINQHIWLEPERIIEVSDGFIGEISIYLKVNNIVARQPVTINFEKSGFVPAIVRGLDFLDGINTFIDSTRQAIIARVAEDTSESAAQTKSGDEFRSDRMFVPKNFYQSGSTIVPRFTTSESQSLFNGKIIIGRPYNILPVKYIDPEMPSVNHEFLFVADPAWNRIIISDNIKDWITAVGSYGTGPLNYNRPVGLAYVLPDLFVVADSYNHRASTYDLKNHDNGEFEFRGYLENDYGLVKDVASAYWRDGFGSHRRIAVLDWTNCQIDIYLVSGQYSYLLEDSFFLDGPGSSTGQLLDPSSICYAKNFLNGQNYSDVYIADAGNKRIVRLDTYDGSVTSSNFQFPSNAYLTSIDVDFYSNVYVVDGYNSTVYQFSPGLSTLYAIYGMRGTADGQLNFPVSLRFSQYWYNVGTAPEMLCPTEVFITEYWTPETGIRRYTPGFDIPWHSLTFHPRKIPGGEDYFLFEWTKSGITKSWRRVFYEGDILQEEYIPKNLVGYQNMWYSSEDSLDEGYYIFEIVDTSIYTPTCTQTVRDSIYVTVCSCGYIMPSWIKPFDEYTAVDIVEDSDSGFTVLFNDYCMDGSYICVKKLNMCGDVDWTTTFSYKDYQMGNAICKTADGGYVIAGECGESFSRPSDFYLIKIDSEGNELWIRSYGDAGSQVAWDIEETQDGGLIITGEGASIMKLDSNGDSLWARADDGSGFSYLYTIKEIPGEGYVMAGGPRIIKTDVYGDTIWSRTDLDGYIKDMDITSDNSYIFTGGLEPRLWLLKANSGGGIEWSKTVTGHIYDMGESIEETVDGGFIIAGHCNGPGGSDHDVFIVRTNACGDSIWTIRDTAFATTAEAHSIVQTADEGFAFTSESYLFGKDIPDTTTQGARVVRLPAQPDAIDFICGDVNDDGSVDMLDILDLQAYIYSQGPPPQPFQSGDTNADCEINMLDILVLIAYLYKQGPPPVCP